MDTAVAAGLTEDLQSTAPVAGLVDLDAVATDVVDRLAKRFEGRVDRMVVEAIVRDCARAFQGARIAAFVPVLVERRSAERVGALSRAGPRLTPS